MYSQSIHRILYHLRSPTNTSLVLQRSYMHDALIDVENEGMAEVVRKYLQECQLMSSLRHPNITQFLGLCFLPGTRLPLLVMERLETNLDNLLEHMPNLPLSLKRSVLEDVASGLLYLHNRPSPVIHRDLTSKNVLLTSSLVAKITDMGNSRIVDMGLGQMARTLTNRQAHQCTGSLFPSTFLNPDNPGGVQGRTELERRDQYIDLLESRILSSSTSSIWSSSVCTMTLSKGPTLMSC